MTKVIIKAPAKVNLFLNITGKRADGYHLLQTMMHTVSIYDTVELQKANEIFLHCNRKDLPKKKGNLAFDAADLFCREVSIPGVKIFLKKRIPSGAGLGGGSSDAAAVLRGMDALYQTNLPLETLSSMAARLGADVPFFLQGGCGYVTGIGEKIQKMPTLFGCCFVVVQPAFRIRTPDAYAAYDRLSHPEHLEAESLCHAYQEGRMQDFFENLGNVLTDAVSSHEISDLVDSMKEAGALSSCMTGSGSAVFGIFQGETAAMQIAKNLKREYPKTFFCRPVDIG